MYPLLARLEAAGLLSSRPEVVDGPGNGAATGPRPRAGRRSAPAGGHWRELAGEVLARR